MASVNPDSLSRRESSSKGGGITIEQTLSSSQFSISLTSQQFDWREGCFYGDEEAPLWLQLFLHIVICAALLIIPIALYARGVVSGPYSIFAPEPPKQVHIPLEIIRWIFFIALAYLGFVLTNLCAVIITYVVYYFYSFRNREAPQKIQRTIDHMLFLRLYVSRFIASIVLVISSFQLFPLTKEEQEMGLFSLAPKEVKQDPQGVVKDTAEVMTGIALAQYFQAYSMSHSIQFFVNRWALSIFVICGLVLIEKIIIQKISATFFYRAFGQRIEDNRFGIKNSKKLRILVLQRHPELSGADLASTIFQGICPQHRTTVTVADIVAFLPAADAERYFSLIDIEATGEITLTQFSRSIKRLLEEQQDLRVAMLDQANVIRKLDKLFFSFAMLFTVIIWMALFQVSLQTVLAALGGIGTILMLVSTGTIKTAFESIIFVIFTHPFDVGDQVIIKNEGYTVKELGLWTSTFEGPGNRITYIANSSLRNEMIVNTRRSPFQSELVRFSILPTTPTERIRLLESKLLSFLQQNSKDYVPKMVITGFNIVNKDTMQMSVPIFHRGNFQDGELKDLRTRNFILYLKEALTDCGILLCPPPIIRQ